MDNAKPWTIKKVQTRNPDTRQLTHHKSWELRFNGKRMAGYRSWDMCIRHVQTYYDKFGHR
jgi:hypothetical protein